MSGEGEVWLILPTYDEAESIAAIVAAAREALPPRRRVLIVDDRSPDGTGEIADRLAGEHDDVEVLHRPGKGGLGPAYVAGFRRRWLRSATPSRSRSPTGPSAAAFAWSRCRSSSAIAGSASRR